MLGMITPPNSRSRHSAQPRMSTLFAGSFLLLITTVLGAACGSESTQDDKKPKAKPTVAITKPRDQSVVRSTFTVTVKTTDFRFETEKVGRRATSGNGHIHFTLDGGQYDTPTHSSEGMRAKTYGTVGESSPSLKPSIMYRGIPDGAHQLTAQLVNNDHTPISGATAQVSFTVSSSGGQTSTRTIASADGVITGVRTGSSVDLKFKVPGGFTTVAPAKDKKNIAGQGHIIWQLDGGEFDTPQYAAYAKLAVSLGITGKYTASPGATMHYKNLPAGQHRLTAYTANNDNTAAGAAHTVTFTIPG